MPTKGDEVHKAWFLIWELYMEQRDWVLLPQNTVSGWRLTKSLCSVSSDILPQPPPPATVTWESTEPNITSQGERLLREELALGVLTTDHSKPEFISSGDCCRSPHEFYYNICSHLHYTRATVFPTSYSPCAGCQQTVPVGLLLPNQTNLTFPPIYLPPFEFEIFSTFHLFSLGVREKPLATYVTERAEQCWGWPLGTMIFLLSPECSDMWCGLCCPGLALYPFSSVKQFPEAPAITNNTGCRGLSSNVPSSSSTQNGISIMSRVPGPTHISQAHQNQRGARSSARRETFKTFKTTSSWYLKPLLRGCQSTWTS